VICADEDDDERWEAGSERAVELHSFYRSKFIVHFKQYNCFLVVTSYLLAGALDGTYAPNEPTFYLLLLAALGFHASTRAQVLPCTSGMYRQAWWEAR
jgi:hypothetical protein